ncbi:hypothetical protein BD413DRAFT_74107 [Trametes elegans]|nr:hypothetical protein BD413DRAFT_74107 [Trametes elegans]
MNYQRGSIPGLRTVLHVENVQTSYAGSIVRCLQTLLVSAVVHSAWSHSSGQDQSSLSSRTHGRLFFSLARLHVNSPYTSPCGRTDRQARLASALFPSLAGVRRRVDFAGTRGMWGPSLDLPPVPEHETGARAARCASRVRLRLGVDRCWRGLGLARAHSHDRSFRLTSPFGGRCTGSFGTWSARRRRRRLASRWVRRYHRVFAHATVPRRVSGKLSCTSCYYGAPMCRTRNNIEPLLRPVRAVMCLLRGFDTGRVLQLPRQSRAWGMTGRTWTAVPSGARNSIRCTLSDRMADCGCLRAGLPVSRAVLNGLVRPRTSDLGPALTSLDGQRCICVVSAPRRVRGRNVWSQRQLRVIIIRCGGPEGGSCAHAMGTSAPDRPWRRHACAPCAGIRARVSRLRAPWLSSRRGCACVRTHSGRALLCGPAATVSMISSVNAQSPARPPRTAGLSPSPTRIARRRRRRLLCTTSGSRCELHAEARVVGCLARTRGGCAIAATPLGTRIPTRFRTRARARTGADLTWHKHGLRLRPRLRRAERSLLDITKRAARATRMLVQMAFAIAARGGPSSERSALSRAEDDRPPVEASGCAACVRAPETCRTAVARGRDPGGWRGCLFSGVGLSLTFCSF